MANLDLINEMIRMNMWFKVEPCFIITAVTDLGCSDSTLKTLSSELECDICAEKLGADGYGRVIGWKNGTCQRKYITVFFAYFGTWLNHISGISIHH